jgi:AcrR family transcriptional regulator
MSLGISPQVGCAYNRAMPATLRQEHRDATRRRIIAAARKVFVKKGYAKATIEEITAAAGVSRATLYLHFDSKFALLAAATEKMRTETTAAAVQLTGVLISGDRAALRQWVGWALDWYVRTRPIALAAQEAELSEDKPSELLLTYLDQLEPWVETWPAERRTEARMRFELCRVQMHHYMWGKSHALFSSQDLPVELFTEIWWNSLKAPLPAQRR